MFASKNQFEFKTPTRRDDLISLCYLLIYLIDPNQLGFIQQVTNMSAIDKFNHIKQKKVLTTARLLCTYHNASSKLFDFVSEVFSYNFNERPDYSKLRLLLTKAMNCPLDHVYDWYPLLNNNWNA